MIAPSWRDDQEFVYTEAFVGSAEGLLTEADLRALEQELLEAPTKGRLIPGTGGVRKIRVALQGRGKSGGARVLYVFSPRAQTIYLLLAYAKNVRDTLTQAEKNALKSWVQKL